MQKSIEYLESKKKVLNPLDTIIQKQVLVTLEHAKTYGKMVEIEVNIQKWITRLDECENEEYIPYYKQKIEHLESKLENLMKS